MAEASFTLRAVDATKQAFANVQNSLAKLQQSSQTAAGFMKKAFDPRAIGAGLAASLGVSLIGVIDMAVKKLIELAMRAGEVKKILAESTKEILKMREDAAFAELDPQGQIAAIDEKRIKNAAEILRLKKATQVVESQMPSVLQGESFSPVQKSNLGTVEDAEKLRKMLAEDTALAIDRGKLIKALGKQELDDKLKAFEEIEKQRQSDQDRRIASLRAGLDAEEKNFDQILKAQSEKNEGVPKKRQEDEASAKSLKDLASAQLDILDPLRQYQREIELVNDLASKGLLTEEQSLARKRQINDEMDRTRGIIEDIIPAQIEFNQIANDAGSLIAQGFEDAILSGQKLGEVVRSLGRDLVRLVFQQMVTQRLASGIATLLGAPPIPVRAMGGPVSSGSPYVVGEKGPELFVPHASGTIVPNHKMGSSGGGGSGGVTVNYKIAAGVSRAELVPILEQERRRLKAEIPDMVRRGGGYRAAFA